MIVLICPNCKSKDIIETGWNLEFLFKECNQKHELYTNTLDDNIEYKIITL